MCHFPYGPVLLRIVVAVLTTTSRVFLCVAQRRLAASAIRARPSGDRFRFFFVFAAFVTAVGKAFSALRGRPAFRGAAFLLSQLSTVGELFSESQFLRRVMQ